MHNLLQELQLGTFTLFGAHTHQLPSPSIVNISPFY